MHRRCDQPPGFDWDWEELATKPLGRPRASTDFRWPQMRTHQSNAGGWTAYADKQCKSAAYVAVACLAWHISASDAQMSITCMQCSVNATDLHPGHNADVHTGH